MPSGRTSRRPAPPPRLPVEAVKARDRTLEQRVDDLASQAREHELRAVPELVRADHLGPGDQARERALSRAAAAADPDKSEAAPASAAAIRSSTGWTRTRSRYPLGMEKLRLGGMALANGVLVHGPTAWGAAVRTADGELRSASGVQASLRSRRAGALLARPVAARRGVRAAPGRPARAAGGAVRVRAAGGRRGRRGRILAAGAARRAPVSILTREAVVALASLAPAALALRGGELASYHGAEHVSIGTYETGQAGDEGARPLRRASRRPLLATTIAAKRSSRWHPRARGVARAVGAVGAIGAAVEVFGWMDRHPGHPVSRVLARPGHELQSRFSTAEPSAAQLEVAEAALAACLKAEAEAVA